ncbi:MAG: hypothetical protein NTV94_12505 [Planctomycetota bacterium]|nr:hypothetical protein [Planctomycetota bacterium]
MSQDEATNSSTQAATAAEVDADAAALAKTSTTIHRKWTFKLVIIIAVSAFMAGFFLVDGLVRYPARGAEAAEYLEFQYLQAYDKERGGISGFTGIDDPQARLAQLAEKLRETGKLDTVDESQKVWLENLKLISQLNPQATAIPRTNFKDNQQIDSGSKRLESLTKTWTTGEGNNRKSPTPLSAFDIPSQWVGMAVSAVIALWVAVVFLSGRSKVYRWDPATLTLTLPTGASFRPGDIAEVDKRKWDKLYVAFKISPSHATLGGKTLEFDLLRYEPLEAWILAMEAAQFPPVKDEEPAPSPTNAPA